VGAPVLVTAAQVASMRAGSIIVDLAVEQGGGKGNDRRVGAAQKLSHITS
jgi:NAD/NADP transhydrogenase alpha subunit